MTDTKKKWLGVASFWLFVYVLVATSLAVLSLVLETEGNRFLADVVVTIENYLSVITFIVAASVWLYLMFHLYYNPLVKEGNRSVWFFAFIFGGFLVSPIYWWIHIWRAPESVQESLSNTES